MIMQHCHPLYLFKVHKNPYFKGVLAVLRFNFYTIVDVYIVYFFVAIPRLDNSRPRAYNNRYKTTRGVNMKKFFADFKAFAMKGNIIDMAVGVVVGGAFGKIVTSFVADIITPLLGILLGNMSVADLKWVIKPEVTELVDGVATVVEPELAMTYGNFIQNIIDFLIIALSIFIVLRIIMSVKKAFEKKKEEEAAAAPPPAPSEELVTLREIRDLLKENKK